MSFFKSITVSLTLFASVLTSPSAQAETLRNGDIIFQTSRSGQSMAIQLATKSRYSHMGIIFYRKNKPYVLEAIGRVTYTPLQRWIRRGHKRHYVVKRLKDVALSKQDVSKLRMESERFLRRKYDLHFGWSDDKIYCSELVWKAYKRALGISIGPIKTLRSFDLTHPVVRKKMRKRYGKKIPLNEKVISPGDMFTASNLRTVNRN